MKKIKEHKRKVGSMFPIYQKNKMITTKEILKGSDTTKFSYYQLEIVEGLITLAIKKAKEEGFKQGYVDGLAQGYNDGKKA